MNDRGRLLRILPLLVAILAQNVHGAARPEAATLVEVEHLVTVKVADAGWEKALPGLSLAAGDIVQTGERSRAVVRIADRNVVRMDELSTLTILPLPKEAKTPIVNFLKGALYLFSRAKAQELELLTPAGGAALRGTEFEIRVDGNQTEVSMLDGEVELYNAAGKIVLRNGERGVVETGRAPRKTPSIDAANIIKWALYYPLVIDPKDLALDEDEQRAVSDSLTAYRNGHLLGALEKYPATYQATSTGGRLYHAAVLLAVGRVDQAQLAMSTALDSPGRRALEQMLAAVWNKDWTRTGMPLTASEWLAESFYLQSKSQLEPARMAATRATEKSPDFGPAWVRLAELEFGFGRTRQALKALMHGIRLSPQNAEAHALLGFLRSAGNQIGKARQSFDEAIRLDGALGTAWLGRGLVLFRTGKTELGLRDLQVAAALEPKRSIFHSYLGKAFSQAGEDNVAERELARATAIESRDPTPWLYSAIQHQQQYRYNESIGDLLTSIGLNDNRRLYRSQFLLDQDGAVRSSNLAKAYQNNAMTDPAIREATVAVENDYTNASAHLLLANSFDALRDPARISLRYETAWFNEQLLAFLLAPVGGGPLSQFVSQQEYSKLLQADGFGGSLITEVSEGGHLDILASIYGTQGRLSSGIDLAYYRDKGTRPNNANSRKEVSWQFKYQPSADDIVYALGQWQEQHGGDLFQNYSNTPGNLGLRFKEWQSPGLALVGWNHRWAPGSHTLLLVGRLAAKQTITAPGTSQILLQRDPGFLQPGFLRLGPNGQLEYSSPELRNPTLAPVGVNPDGSLRFSPEFQNAIAPFLGGGPVTATFSERFDFATERNLKIHSAEIEHLWHVSRNTLLLGGRCQDGDFKTDVRLNLLNAANDSFFESPAALQSVSTDFTHQSLYAYDFFKATPWMTLIVGAAWDHIDRPENFRNPPVTDRQTKADKTSAKFGFRLSPLRWITVRGVFTEALGGVTFDDSVRLEPVQLAGFNQAFRTIISESLVGSVEAPIYRQRALSVEGALPTRTWWAVTGSVLDENVKRTVGAFDIFASPIFPTGFVTLPAGTRQTLHYREQDFSLGINQLAGKRWSFGANYRRTRAELRAKFPDVAVTINPNSDRFDEATLHELEFATNWNDPSGWFARGTLSRYEQSLSAMAGGQPSPSPPGDAFWQANVELGRRFHRNQREVSLGVRNLTDQDYHLSPLAYTRVLSRERTFFVRFRVNF